MLKKKSLLVVSSLILAFGILVGCSTDDTEPDVNNDIEAPVLNPGGDTPDPDVDADVDGEEDTEVDTEEDNG